MTTLEGVNEILTAAGLAPVPALDTSGASWARTAEDCLNRVAADLQSDGYPTTVRLKVEVSPELYTFDNAAWTDSTRTLTQTGAFVDASVGQTIEITGGSGVTLGEYEVTGIDATNGDYIVLATDINGAGGDIGSGVTGEATSNQIVVPDGCLDIDATDSDAWRDIVQIGDHLYDRDDNTDQFDAAIKCEYTLRYGFGCLPYKLQQYIVAKASVTFYERFPAMKGMILARLMEHELNAKVRADQFRSDLSDTNLLFTQHNLEALGYRNGTMSPPIYDGRFWP